MSTGMTLTVAHRKICRAGRIFVAAARRGTR